MSRPDYVLNFKKPDGTGIKEVKGHFYLYRRSYKYDPEKKKSVLKWGEYLGRVDETGFHPKRVERTSGTEEAVVEAGATRWCWETTEWMRTRLKQLFPTLWRKMYIAAVLNAVSNDRLHRLSMRYSDSLISWLMPGEGMSAASMTRMLKTLGTQRTAMEAYMEEDLQDDQHYLLVDGHRVLSDAKDMDTAKRGYDSKHRHKLQINLMYLFSGAEDGPGMPVYYRQFAGNEVDISAVPMMLERIHVLPANAIFVGDKGCTSVKILDLVTHHGLFYCVPLKRNNKFVKNRIPSTGGYETTFIYRDRPIQCTCFPQDGFNVFIYLDIELYANETGSLARRLDRQNTARELKRKCKQKRLEEAENNLGILETKFAADQTNEALKLKLDACRAEIRALTRSIAQLQPVDISQEIAGRPAMGTITLRTNQPDMDGRMAYMMYKQREAIEDFFKLYAVTLENEASYMRNEQTMESWLFLNHLTAQIASRAMSYISSLSMKGTLSWDDMRRALSMVRAIRQDGMWRSAPVTPEVLRICQRLQIDPYDLSLMDGINPR